MIAAIYARKSTEQNVSDDAKSVTRQVERGREYAAKNGWTVADEHLYIDDGVSGAEFVKRPGLARLLAATLSPRPPFQALIISEESRIGRDTIRTLAVLQQIQDAGVRIFAYLEGREITLEEDTDEIQEYIRGWAAQSERRKASQRTSDALRRRAEKGLVAGGKVYGYTNVREGSTVKRTVNEAEAAILRCIFTLVAEGWGLLRIAKRLTAEDGRGWAVTTLRGMLDRDLYRGHVIYGQTHNVRRGGTKKKVKVPESERIVLEQPDLRIIDDALWEAAHARTRQTYTGRRTASGTLHGRPESGLTSRHLLAGHLRCGTCGGGMFVAPRTGARGQVRLYYLCTNHHKQGTKGCANHSAVPTRPSPRRSSVTSSPRCYGRRSSGCSRNASPKSRSPRPSRISRTWREPKWGGLTGNSND